MATATTRTEAGSPATVIDSPRHPVARRISDVLRSRSGKPTTFVIDDHENIAQAVAQGIRLDSLYVAESPTKPAFWEVADLDPGVPAYGLSPEVVRALFGEQKLSRCFALAHAPRPPRLRDLTGSPGDIVVLDGVRLVGNIGAITRTACALGAAGVVLLDSGLRTVLDRRLIRASRGLVFAVPVILATREQFTGFVAREDLALASLSADAPIGLNSIRRVRERLALVMGGERDGVSPQLDALTDHRYAIPMASHAESLNVSVAAGIALYEHGTR